MNESNHSEQPSQPVQNHESDSEWEYEYSQTETDTFYITLDLTSSTPNFLRPSTGKRKRDRTPLQPSSRRNPPQGSPEIAAKATTFTPVDGQEAEDEEAEREEAEIPVSPGDVEARSLPGLADNVGDLAENRDDGSQTDDEPKRLQLLDICTSNPLLCYNNQFYSCHWANAVGTDLFITPNNQDNEGTTPGPDSDPLTHSNENTAATLPKIYSDPNFHILGANSLRLVAKPIKTKPRPPLPPSVPATAPEPVPASSVEATPQPARTADGKRPARNPEQADFIRRFTEVKARLGEQDTVTTDKRRRREVQDNIPIQTLPQSATASQVDPRLLGDIETTAADNQDVETVREENQSAEESDDDMSHGVERGGSPEPNAVVGLETQPRRSRGGRGRGRERGRGRGRGEGAGNDRSVDTSEGAEMDQPVLSQVGRYGRYRRRSLHTGARS